MTDGKYARVYFTITEDERFRDVYHDARHLGTWLQLLLVAEAMYPSPAPIPAYVSRSSLKVLVDAGIIELCSHQHYRVHGLASERELRSQNARNAAAVRWHSDRNAPEMLVRERVRERERVRAEDEHLPGEDGRDDLEAWLLVKHRAPTPRQRAWLDGYMDTFDQTGPQRAAKIILSHPDDPIAALKEDRDAFLRERAEAITVEPKHHSRTRSRSGLTPVSAELARLWAQQSESKP